MNAIKTARTLFKPLLSRQSWQLLGNYVGIGNNNKATSLSDAPSLAEFISSRASHVAQTSLYGYLRTRAGTRFPELFENPDIIISINIAKWHVWVACVSDLSIFIGHLAGQSGIEESKIIGLLSSVFEDIIEETGTPEEAGEDFSNSIEKASLRISQFTYSQPHEEGAIFIQSPEALYYWSPIAEELKERDKNIVRNSVRFRWIDVRRSCRKLIDFESLFNHPAVTD